LNVEPVRVLALLWRACTDLEGACLFAQDDIRTADLMHVAGLGHVEKRRPKPHQLNFFEANQTPYEEMWLTYFIANDQGCDLWDRLLEHVEDHVRASPAMEQPGREE
jgi:hypothetical protein